MIGTKLQEIMKKKEAPETTKTVGNNTIHPLI